MTQASAPARILEVTSYPPPRAGWGIRVEFVKKRLETQGHECVVLNIGSSRNIPSAEYETVGGAGDFVRKVWRYSKRGFVVHSHANGDAIKGTVLALTAQLVNMLWGRRAVLTFHAGVIQRYFPREKSGWLFPLYWLLFATPKQIICNSEPVKARICQFGISPDKIVPIPAFSRQYLEYIPVPLPAPVEQFLARYPKAVFTYVRMRPLFFPVTLVEGMAAVMKRRPDVGLILCGMAGHEDAGVKPDFEAAVRRHAVEDRLCLVDDMDHDTFLTAMQRCSLYLRTPITDGVASSVLEALALGVPVVASENGTRPLGVLTYPAQDAQEMASAIERVLDHREESVAATRTADIPDTVWDEVLLLTS